MIQVLILMIIGIVIGRFIRNNRKLIKINDKLTTIAIFILLFAMGINIGLNDKIIRDLDNVGLSALLITVAALLGSLVFSLFVYKLWFKNK